MTHHFRIQGSSVTEKNCLECSESDNDLDDLTRDPNWSPQQEDEEAESSDKEEHSEKETVKRN